MPSAKTTATAGETPAAVPAVVPGRSSDWDHPNLGWTVQMSVKFENTDAIPGQVFVQAQLPDPKAQVAAGIDPATHNAGLVVVSDEEAKSHPGGPEPTDNLVLAGAPTPYAGTSNAATVTAPGATDAPAVVSTVDQVPPTA